MDCRIKRRAKCRVDRTRSSDFGEMLYRDSKSMLMNLRPLVYSQLIRVEQLKLGHMFNIINVKAPEYLRTNVQMLHHRYIKRASKLACVIPRVKGSGQTSFLYASICHLDNLPTELKQCQSKTSLKKVAILYISVVWWFINYNLKVAF